MESESEFLNLCIMVQDNGYIDVKKAKEVRNYKVFFVLIRFSFTKV